MLSICLLAISAFAQPRKRADSPDLKEMRDYKLSLDAVQRYVGAIKTLNADPAAAKCTNSPGNAPTLDEGEKLLNACAPAVAAVKAAGLKPREFLILTAALIGDMMAAGMKKQGTIKEYPASISPENAAFVEQNYDKLQKILGPVMSGNK